MAPPKAKTRKEQDQENQIAALNAEIAALKAGAKTAPASSNEETIWSGVSPTDADIIREAARGRHMVTPPEAAEIEKQVAAGGRGPSREEFRTTFDEDEKGNLTVSRQSLASASAPIPPDPHKGGRDINNLGETAVDETEDVT